jgi:hypothetical protein
MRRALSAHDACLSTPEEGSARPLQGEDDADRSREDRSDAMTAKL